MKLLQFGNPEHKKLMLIHGMQAPWQVWKPQIDYFSKNYHVIIPILNGHNPDEARDFTSLQQEAAEIEAFYIEQFGERLFSICGMSMGGTIASILWANGKLKIEKLFLESAPLVPQNKWLTSFITQQYIRLTHKTKQRDSKTLQTAEETFIPKEYMPDFLKMMDAMSDDTIKHCVRSVGQFQLPANLNADSPAIAYCHGTALNEMIAKKSASYLKRHYPQAKIIRLNGYSHCELSLRHPKQYIAAVEEFL